MILSRCLVLAVGLTVAATVAGQTSAPAPASPPSANAFPGDERAAKLAERYRAMLVANPVEGIALDRWWKIWEDHGATAALIAQSQADAQRTGSASAWLIDGHVLKKAGQFDGAAAAYDQAAKADPTGLLPLLAKADLALARRDPAAAALFDDALSKIPTSDRRRADLLMKLGSAWLAAGKPEKAAESWEQIVAANPSNLALHKRLAETYAQSHLTDQALVHYVYIDQHADAPARAAALREAGRLHESRGEFEAARDAFERGEALTSRDNWLHGELQAAIIRLYQRAGRESELEARWRRAADQAPRDLGSFLRLLALADMRGDMSAQKEWLQRITTLAPRDRDSRVKLARLLAATGEREKAAILYDQLLKDQPNQLELLFARADLDLQLGQPALAISRLETRQAKGPADETVATPILDFFLARHLDEPSERILRAAVDRQPAALEAGMALAKFYFARRRVGEGRHVLDVLANQPESMEGRKERWQRLAVTYRDENLPGDALRCWEQVARLAPQDPAPVVAIGELLLARGDSQAAADAMQHAIDLAPEGAIREEVEHKLFQILAASDDKTAGSNGEASGATPRRRAAMSLGAFVAAGRPEATIVVPGGPLNRYLDALEEAATLHPTPAKYLRLARWQTWAHAAAQATVAAMKARSLDPQNIAAQVLLVSLAVDANQHEVAESRLRALIALDPANKSAYLRQIAGLQMEDGDFDTALAAYNELQEQQPGSIDALTELALAQQRADHWFDALTAWKRAYSLPSLTPAQRSDVRRPLVATYEHLGEFRQGAELLQAAVDDQPEPARKQDLFHDLTEFCGQHALSDWLAGTYEARLRAQPDDYFTMVAVAELWKREGREMEAYQLLARAYYSASDPVAALKTLADEAEALGEDEQAVADRRRLVAMAGQDTSENLEKLAALEENNLDDDAASRTWDQIVTRFPRDTGALIRAAEFFERVDKIERVRGLLTQVVAIDPGDVQRLFHLAELRRDAGDLDGARTQFEQVLAQSDPEKPGEALRLPPELAAATDPAFSLGGVPVFYRSSSSPPPAPAAGGNDRALRLQAIRELARLLPGSDAPPGASNVGSTDPRKTWLARWSAAAAAGARSEPLQALYAAHEVDAVMDLLDHWMAQRPSDELARTTFLMAGLRLGDYRRLAEWAWPEDVAVESATRSPLLVDALLQFLVTGGQPADHMVAGLFPPHVKARDLLWKAAREGFAEHHWYAQAAELGERVAASVSSGRAAYALETAQWELFLGRTDRARAVLGDAIAEGGGTAYDGLGGSPIFQALRAYYFLLSADERAVFVDRYVREWRDRGEPIHGLLSAILLHGLQGNEETAKGELDTLLSMRMVGQDASGSPDVRRWNYLLVNGAQLQSWNLGSLAAHLWRRALQEVTAFDRQKSGLQSTLTEIRSRLVGLEVATAADPEEAHERVASYLHANPPAGLVAAEATQLMATSHFAAARQFYEYLTVLEPEDGENWRNLVSVCESEGDPDATESILAGLLDGSRPLPPSLNRAELVRQLAMLRRSGGDTAGALRLLEHEFQRSTRGVPVTTTLAQEYERTEMLGDAVRVWQEGMASDPGNARNYRLALARVEERRGNLPEAISLLEAEIAAKNADGGDEPLLRLAKLYLNTGRLEEAKRLALGALQAKQTDALIGLVRVFTQAGQQDVARGWLATAVRRSRDAQTRFQLQRELLQANLKPTDLPLADFVRELRRLRRIARAAPTLNAECDSVSYELADRRGADDWLEGELKHEWRDGAGDFTAGERLVGFYLDRHQTDPARLILQTINHRPNLSDQALFGLEKRLIDADLSILALPVSERLCERYPQNEAFILGRAQVLWKAGRPGEADRLLEDLDRTSALREDFSPQIAALYQAMGNTHRAREFYARAVQRDPAAVRSQSAYLGLAHIEAGRQNWPEVRRLLFQVYRHPAAGIDLRPLAEYLCASGPGTGETMQRLSGDRFPLTFTKRAQLIALVYEQLKTSGQKDEADRLIVSHPTFLAGAPALTAVLRGEKTPAQLPAIANALEQAIARADPSVPRLNRELSALYVRWSDLQANGDEQDVAGRLAHLVRANQLVPEDFEAARRLAALSWELGQPAQAITVLQPFLTVDAVPAEEKQARQLLAKH